MQFRWCSSRRTEAVGLWVSVVGWWEVTWHPCFCTVWGSLSSFSPGRKWLFLPKEFKNPSYHHSLWKDWWSYRENTAGRERQKKRKCTDFHKETEWSCWQTQNPEIREKFNEETQPEVGFCIEFWMKTKPFIESAGKDSVLKWCTLNICWIYVLRFRGTCSKLLWPSHIMACVTRTPQGTLNRVQTQPTPFFFFLVLIKVILCSIMKRNYEFRRLKNIFWSMYFRSQTQVVYNIFFLLFFKMN